MPRTATQENTSEISGTSKAAILLIALGPEKSAKVFKHLKEEEIEQLTLEIANTRSVSPQMKEDVLNEFYQVAFRRKLYQSLEELQAAGHMDRQLQHPKNPPGQNVLRKDSHADAY